jgi:hypothetical protein
MSNRPARPAAALPGMAALVCTVLALTPAAAQTPLPRLTPGTVIEGTLAPSDPGLNRMGPFRAYTFEARAGERFRIEMTSGDFDTYLSVARTVGALTDVIASDDDGGEGTNALLRFRAPADDTYIVIAQAFMGGGTGDYRLAFDRLPEPEPASATAVALGTTTEGTLREGSPLLDDDSRFDLYSFTGRAGQRVTVTMRSDDFDAFLFLLARSNEETVLASDDDGAGDLDARIRHTLPADGEYLVRAATRGAGAGGRYTLELREHTRVARQAAPLRAGTAVRDALEEDDEQLEGGAHFHDWSYTAAAGERLRITLRSDDFDTYLAIGRTVNGVFQSLEEDDDGAGGTDSRLDYTVPAAGEYTVRAHSYRPGATGTYSLELERR